MRRPVFRAGCAIVCMDFIGTYSTVATSCRQLLVKPDVAFSNVYAIQEPKIHVSFLCLFLLAIERPENLVKHNASLRANLQTRLPRPELHNSVMK